MRVHMNTPEGGIPESGIVTVIEGNRLRIFFDIEREEPQLQEADQKGAADSETEAEQPAEVYVAENIDVEGNREYPAIVSAIHNGRYSNDSVQAIIANNELAKDATSDIPDTKRAEYLADYKAWQDWRAHAKDIAKKVINQI